MRRLRTASIAILLLTLGFGAGWIQLPLYSEGPGPPLDVASLIRFEGHRRYDSAGRLVFTTIRIRRLTPFDAVLAWLDPTRGIVSERDVYPPGLSRRDEELRAVSDMDQSKIAAAGVVLERLTGYPDAHGRGALIASVFPGCPADGRLFAGDLVVAVDGQKVTSVSQARHRLGEAGDRLTLRVSAGGATHDVPITRAACLPGDDERYVGFGLVEPFPFQLSISSGGVGGPSAGLMFALGLYDLLTPGDLTDGRTVAGTGTIDPDGAIGSIGGIEEKVVTAERAGADLFLVPRENLADLGTVDTGEMRLVPVATFDDALRALASH